MTVKNIAQFHHLSLEELNKLSTRHLVNILESSRGKIICDCGKGHHCGDDVLSSDELVFNAKQNILFNKVKEVLSERENLVSTKQVKKKEKKVLKF